jgi:hypothetical protein
VTGVQGTVFIRTRGRSGSGARCRRGW